MQQFALSKGLNLPIQGIASSHIEESPRITKVAVIGDDYIGLKPRLEVQEGDEIVAGDPIFADKSTPEAKIVAPMSGVVEAINRGARRKLISVVIRIGETKRSPIDFSKGMDANSREGLTELLCSAGLWTSFRTRPYSKVPLVGSQPSAIYITATDTEPLAA
ncbi:MAG: NADH:ubiquinone reductase (Na(+)-transporting) subunit A, partial [Pseudomonadota bacterium]